MDQRIIELAKKYAPLAEELLAESVRIPEDYVDEPLEQGGDPLCGLSNHEGPRLEYLRRRIIELGAVVSPEDVGFDGFGNLVWSVEDRNDGVPSDEKVVIYLDGHSDTVQALREGWVAKLRGIDAYRGMVDPAGVDEAELASNLGWLPPREEWANLLFGRGTADQLGGVVCQIVATKIMLELMSEGALRGAIVRCYATACEEDNDGAGPMYVMRRELPGAPPRRVPDVVILTEGTGHAELGACGIYRGQRGRMQIELEVTGRSAHGSMPWEGLNPLEHGGRIVAEAADRYEQRAGFLDNEFLGHGTRTASWSVLDSPSDCAVPQRLLVRFDRRLTAGETPEQAVADIEGLPSVERARRAGLDVQVRVPLYDQPTWKGTIAGNPQIYASWVTPEDHPAIGCAVDAYNRVVGPQVQSKETGGYLRRQPRVGRWIFSTDGVGYPLPREDTSFDVPDSKRWLVTGAFKHPAMFGFGPGIEQNTHKIGECVDKRELPVAIALLARFPSLYAVTRRA